MGVVGSDFRQDVLVSDDEGAGSSGDEQEFRGKGLNFILIGKVGLGDGRKGLGWNEIEKWVIRD